MKLSKSSALLFGVLNGGLHGRRPVKVIKKQALVSFLYPNMFFDSLGAENSVTQIQLKEVAKRYQGEVEQAKVASSVFFAGIRSTKISLQIETEVNLSASSSVFGIKIKNAKINAQTDTETLSASNAVAEISVFTRGIYLRDVNEEVSTSNGVHQISLIGQ